MAIVYSLANPLTGVSIDPTTGVITGDATIPLGASFVEIVRTDDQTGLEVDTPAERCRIDFDVQSVAAGVDCITCLDTHLDGTPHLDTADINAIITTYLTDNPPVGAGGTVIQGDVINVPPSLDCSDPVVIRVAYNGTVYTVVDADGDGIIDVQLRDVEVPYYGSNPLPGTAVPGVEYDADKVALIPRQIVAGSPDLSNDARIQDVRYFASNGRWLPIGDPGVTLGDTFDTCLAAPSTSYPLRYDTRTSGVLFSTIFKPFVEQCSAVPSVFFPSEGAYYPNFGGTASVVPDVVRTWQSGPNEVDGFVLANTALGSGNTYTEPTNTSTREAVRYGTNAWAGVGGVIEMQRVESFELAFTIEGGGSESLGVSLIDWLAGSTMEAKAMLETASGNWGLFDGHASIPKSLAAGQWRILFEPTPQATAGNWTNVSPWFWGLGTDSASGITVKDVSMTVRHRTSEPCGVFNNPGELAAAANNITIGGVTWSARADGAVCATIPEDLRPSFTPLELRV